MPSNENPLIALLVLLAKLSGELAFFSVLIRYAMEPYRIYGFPPLMERFLHVVDKVCMPVERAVFSMRLPMVSVSIFVLGISMAFIRGLLYSFFTFGSTAYFYGIGGIPQSFKEFFEFLFCLLLLMALLSTIMRRTNVWQYRNIPLQLIDRIAGSLFGAVAKLIGHRRRWLMLIASVLLLSILYGGICCVLVMRYDWRILLTTSAMIPVSLLNYFAMLLIVRVLLSWFQAGATMEGHIPQVLHACTDPYLEPFQRMLPFLRYKGIDLSPIISIGVLFFLGGQGQIMVQNLFGYYLTHIPIMGG